MTPVTIKYIKHITTEKDGKNCLGLQGVSKCTREYVCACNTTTNVPLLRIKSRTLKCERMTSRTNQYNNNAY